MCVHDWPGNVRELESFVHRLVLMSDHDEIDGVDAGNPATGKEPFDSSHAAATSHSYPSFHDAKAVAVASFERRYLAEVMAQTRGNVSAAARLAHKERRALGKLLKKHGIDRQSFQD